MIDSNHINTYLKWEKELEELGYISKKYVLNSINFGSCQNRQRVFVISVLNKHQKKTSFEFPDLENIKSKNKKPIKDILTNSKQFNHKFNEYEIIDKGINANNIRKYELVNYTNFNSENYIYDINFSGPTLTASGALSRIKLYFNKNKIREMNAKEAFKYMGFSEEDYENVKQTKLIPDSKKIFLCGNSISVQVLEEIFRSLRF